MQTLSAQAMDEGDPERMWTFVGDFWPWLLGLLDVLLATAATIHIVLRKRESRAAIGWVGLVWLAPLVGSALYYGFGINRIQRKAVALRGHQSWACEVEWSLTKEETRRRGEIVNRYPNLVGLAMVGRSLTARPVVPGNRVEALMNGDEAYPAMLEAIRGAKRSVALLSYIFDSDRAGDAFLEALVEAKGRGVEVRVLIDDVGSRYSKANMIPRLRAAGLRAASFLPLRVPRLFQYANLRNHRKILVVDGRVGFTGGTNIRECHWLSLGPKAPMQCVHFLLEGPVVRHLQEVFAVDWAFATSEILSGDAWFPDLARAGPVWARGIPNGPDEDFEKMSAVIFAALSVASDTVRVVTPYFLPDTPLVRALNTAAMRGVDVRIYLPEENDVALVHWASMAQLWQLLEKGCRLFFTPPPFDHTKLLVVDGVWSLIGSTNWDPRSLRLNFEFNVECYDDAFAATLGELIGRKAQDAREITLDDVNHRSLPLRIRDGLARLLTPYL